MLKKLLQVLYAPIKTTWADTDYLIGIIGGQVSKILKTNTKIPFLNENNIIPSEYIPYVDRTIIEVENYAALPETGETSYRYVTLDDLHSYFWTTSGYIDATDGGLVIGETSTTAYRGDRGKIAYDFSQGTGVTDLADFNSKIETLTDYLYPNTPGITITENYTLLYAFVKTLFSDVRIVTAYVVDKPNGKTTIFQKVGYSAGGVWSWENWQNIGKSSEEDIIGLTKIATVTFLKTEALPAYTSINGVLTADANGLLTLDDSQTPVDGSTLFYSINNTCYTITSKGGVSSKWVLTPYLPNGISNNQILITTTLTSYWYYANSVYNRIYTKSETDAALALKVDAVSGSTLLSSTQAAQIASSYNATSGTLILDIDDMLQGDDGLYLVDVENLVADIVIDENVFMYGHVRTLETLRLVTVYCVNSTTNQAYIYQRKGNFTTVWEYGDWINMYDKSYAEIYFADASTAQNIPTGATYTKITAFTNNGTSNKETANATNDKITILRKGVYLVNITCSSYSGTVNITLRTALFAGGTECGNIQMIRKFSNNASDISTGHCCGFLNVTSVPVDIDVRVRHDNGGTVELTPVSGNLNILKIG